VPVWVARGGKSPHGGFSESLAGQKGPTQLPRFIRGRTGTGNQEPGTGPGPACCALRGAPAKSGSVPPQHVGARPPSWAGAFPERLPGFAPRGRWRWVAARAFMEAVRWPSEAAAGGRAGAVVPLRWCDFRLRALPHPCLLPWQQETVAVLYGRCRRQMQAADTADSAAFPIAPPGRCFRYSSSLSYRDDGYGLCRAPQAGDAV
jgi:hypothetical protein